MPRDVFLVLRRDQLGEVVYGSFPVVTLRLGVPLRRVIDGTEWVSVDGDLSLIRLCDDAAVT